MAIDRLSVRDAVNLYWGEDDSVGVLLGWVAMVDRWDVGVATDAEAVARITAAIAARVPRVPRLRQRLLHPPRGLGLPLWVDDTTFDMARHVSASAVPAPGGPAQLNAHVERLFGPALPLDRPLWRVEVVTGLDGGQVAVVQIVHHALADGVAGAAIAAALLDLTPSTEDAPPPAWTPAPPPTRRRLLVDNLRWRAGLLRRLLTVAAHPARTARNTWAGVRELRTMTRDVRARPPTSLNRRLGPRRRLDHLAVSLEAVRHAGHAGGGTINDVVLAAVAGGLRQLLSRRGEDVSSARLFASVPVSVRTGAAAELGNRTSGLVVDLRVDEPDDRRRLATIAAATRGQKQSGERVKLMAVMDSPWIPAALHRRAGVLLRDQRMINVMVSNVAGPPVPLFMAGARVSAIVPVLPIAVNVPIGVAAISYAGTLALGVRSDPDAVPDIEAFLDGLRGSLAALVVRNGGRLRSEAAAAPRSQGA